MDMLPTTHPDRNTGFTVLYAMVVVSVVVLLGSTLTGIFLRGSLLASSSLASSQAFYAADTALECAIYFDREHDAFSTSSPNVSLVDCGGTPADDESASRTGGGPNREYHRTFKLDSSEICAGVTVIKYTNSDGDPRTRIAVRGRNTCQNTGRQAERALRTSYSGH